MHPLYGVELRALRRLQREAPQSEFVFLSQHGTPFTTAGFAKMVERAGVEAGCPPRSRRVSNGKMSQIQPLTMS
jgi:site-specific recombinase XerD